MVKPGDQSLPPDRPTRDIPAVSRPGEPTLPNAEPRAAQPPSAPPAHPPAAPPAQPPAAPPVEPKSEPPHPSVRRTRAGSIWVSLTAGGLFGVALLIFVVQNTESVRLGFLGWHFNLPIGVAILVAAVVGLLVMAVAGSIRIIQLRQAFSKLNRSAARQRQG
ncbi:lipopolysaccharide assembly protein LapA domain-containing protein [Nocardia sp. NPDC005978]|uniref:LapA family protein n=1 Tax=Nocardia sp. NPDC005978 TaxID=3156725 RepID=UPI0033AD48AF